MLFGVSVLLYAGKSGDDMAMRGLWFRRMAWLLVIGLVHAYLIWNGDILVPYALCGLIVLWWVRRRSARALMIGAAALLLIGASLSAAHGLSWGGMTEAQRAEELAMWTPSPAELRAQIDGLRGGFVDIVRYRAPETFMFQTFIFALFFFWRCSGMMLLGMSLYKSGFLDGRLPARTYAIVSALCLPAGLGLSWLGAMTLDRVAYAMPQRTFADLWNYAGAMLASVGYAALLIYVVKRGLLAGLRRTLAAVGQMALTNYLFQSVITSAIFLGWGLGLVGRLDYADQLLVVLAIWTFQLAVSPLWLARFRFGPAEWLWRSLTYWRPQPMRLMVRLKPAPTRAR
jgi:uncharacterized protein